MVLKTMAGIPLPPRVWEGCWTLNTHFCRLRYAFIPLEREHLPIANDV